MSKSYCLPKTRKEEDGKKEENFCSKCGTGMVLLKTGQGWGFDFVYKCPNCPPINYGHSKGFGG